MLYLGAENGSTYTVSLSYWMSICFSRQVDAPRKRERLACLKNVCSLCCSLLQRKLPSCIPRHDFLLLICCKDTPWSWMTVDATHGTVQCMEPSVIINIIITCISRKFLSGPLVVRHLSIVDCKHCVFVALGLSVRVKMGVNRASKNQK